MTLLLRIEQEFRDKLQRDAYQRVSFATCVESCVSLRVYLTRELVFHGADHTILRHAKNAKCFCTDGTILRTHRDSQRVCIWSEPGLQSFPQCKGSGLH